MAAPTTAEAGAGRGPFGPAAARCATIGAVPHPAYPLQTARLVLRPFATGDLADLADIHGRPEVARFLYWEPRDTHGTQRVLDTKVSQRALNAQGDRLTLAVTWPEADRVVGEVSLVWLSRQDRQGEVGFVFHPDFQRRGLATESAAALVDWGFCGLGLHRIVGRCDARNIASTRVMERLGMRREAHFVHSEIFKGAWGDELVYAILEDEWSAGP